MLRIELDSEDSYSIDTVHCIIVDEKVFEDHIASTSANTENDDFIDLASQVVGNSLTVKIEWP